MCMSVYGRGAWSVFSQGGYQQLIPMPVLFCAITAEGCPVPPCCSLPPNHLMDLVFFKSTATLFHFILWGFFYTKIIDFCDNMRWETVVYRSSFGWWVNWNYVETDFYPIILGINISCALNHILLLTFLNVVHQHSTLIVRSANFDMCSAVPNGILPLSAAGKWWFFFSSSF